jgi:hypothetical protein
LHRAESLKSNLGGRNGSKRAGLTGSLAGKRRSERTLAKLPRQNRVRKSRELPDIAVEETQKVDHYYQAKINKESGMPRTVVVYVMLQKCEGDCPKK